MSLQFIPAILLTVACTADPPLTLPDDPPQPTPTTAPATAARSLDRPVVLGASATNGFAVTLKYEHTTGHRSAAVKFNLFMDAAIRAPHETVLGCSSAFFFARPITTGDTLVQCALDHDPTVVIGTDLLFWYAYGDRGPDGRAFRDDAERLELLEVGLQQLERFDCPVFVGDLPDMSGAVGGMLRAHQVPTKETLQQLNAAVHRFAETRPDIHVLPIADAIATMQRGEALKAGPARWTPDDPALLQVDQLHPTADGLAMTALIVAHELVRILPDVDADDVQASRLDVLARARTILSQR